MIYKYYHKLNIVNSEEDFKLFTDILDQIKCKKYSIDSLNYSFYTNKNIKIYLNDYQCSRLLINNIYNDKIINILKKYTICIISIIIFITIIIFLNNTIINIKFSNIEHYDSEVYQCVTENVKYIYKFGYLKKDIDTLNKELRSKFYEYQWISIEKKGTTLLINISKTNDDKINQENDYNGSLYSKYDAYILGYYCKQGKVVIQNNSYVIKGQELISGIIPGYDNANIMVKADGYVIGEVTVFQIINIPKTQYEMKRTGNISREIILYNLNNNINFSEINYEIKQILKIGKIVLAKKYYYETKQYINNISKNEALDIGINKINYQFNKDKKYDFEKVISIKEINIIDNNNYFQIMYKINKIIDITEFISY